MVTDLDVRVGSMSDNDEILTPGDVADLFGVNPKTVARWARVGRIPFFTTLGGHRRFYRHDVEQLLEQGGNG